MSLAVGSQYETLLAEFLLKGGDPSLCPFDAGDYKYEGPVLEGMPWKA